MNLDCRHACVPKIEQKILSYIDDGRFEDIKSVRFSRHIQDEFSKRWYHVPPYSKKANIPIRDGLKFGKLMILDFLS